MALSNIDQMLINAARAGDNAKVIKALDNGADIHAGDDAALLCGVENCYKDTSLLLLCHGADANKIPPTVLTQPEGFQFLVKQEVSERLTKWVSEHKQKVLEYFKPEKPAPKQGFVARWLGQAKQVTSPKPYKPSREQCFTTDKKGKELHDKVLESCVTGQFTALIGAPLTASTEKDDRQLFQDIWDALPQHWQDQNQNIYMQFVKDGGLNPIIGPHTAAAQQDSLSAVSRMGR